MKQTLERLFAGDTLTTAEASALLLAVADGSVNTAQAAATIAALRMRAVTVDELLGFRQALLERALSVDLSSYEAIDIVGTGGDGKNTFNISTCAAFVVAGAGRRVAKHGNFGASSVSGASTVLQVHGANFTTDATRLRRSIEESGVAYMHAPLFHPALGSVAPLRRALGVKTFFNLLGPLVNPARPGAQLLGVADLAQFRLYTNTLRRLDINFNVVTSFDGFDEITPTADFKVASPESESIYSPGALGLQRAGIDALSGGSTPEEAARVFDDVLQGKATSAQTDAVVLNAAFALRCFEPSKPVADCIGEARESLASGRALRSFTKFLEING